MQAGVRPLSTEELLLAETRESKTIAFGLRTNAGIDPELLPATTTSSLLSAKKDSSKTTPPASASPPAGDCWPTKSPRS